MTNLQTETIDYLELAYSNRWIDEHFSDGLSFADNIFFFIIITGFEFASVIYYIC